METNKLGVGHYNVKIISKKPVAEPIENSGIYETMSYDSFHMDIKNRPIDDKKVTAFMNQFKKGKNFMKEYPVIVDKTYLILDGQHRFMALKILGGMVYFKFADTLTIDNVVDVQSNAGWHTHDFLHAFIQQKKQDYIVLHRFVQRYKLNISVALSLLTGNFSGGLKTLGFYAGTFKVKDEPLAHERAKMIFEISALSNIPTADKGFCMSSIKVIHHPDYDHSRMVSQLKKYGTLMKRQVKVEFYMRNFEEVYNYKLYMKNKVRFI